MLAAPPGAHARCAYCSALLPFTAFIEHVTPPLLCPAPLPPGCFSCGAAALASATQRARAADGLPARCAACVREGRAARRAPPPPPPPTPDEALAAAVGDCDDGAARAALAAGADADAPRQAAVAVGGRAVALLTAAGAPLAEDDAGDVQPTTPLKLVGFRLSDCTLDEAARARLLACARALLAAGARAAPALRHMERRYGPAAAATRGDAFGEVFALVAEAAEGEAARGEGLSG